MKSLRAERSEARQDTLTQSPARLQLMYRTGNRDQDSNVELPFRLLVLGDFRGRKTGAHDQIDLARFEYQPIRRVTAENLDAVMRDMAIQVDVTVPVPRSGGDANRKRPLSLTFSSLRSFMPGEIAAQIPDARALLEAGRVPPSSWISGIGEERWQRRFPDVAGPASRAESPLVEGDARALVAAGEGQAADTEDSESAWSAPGLDDALSQRDMLVNRLVSQVLHEGRVRELEAAWRGLAELLERSAGARHVQISILDVTKEELARDFEEAHFDLTSSVLFQKLYTGEFDQYGGRPIGVIVGLYEFENTPADLQWLGMMARIANACYAPFIGALRNRFFGCSTLPELELISDFSAELSKPRYQGWQALRARREAPFIGLVFPRYLIRPLWNPVSNPSDLPRFTEVFKRGRTLSEDVAGDLAQPGRQLWGNPALLFAANLVRSFERYGWCQFLRGPQGGGLVDDLVRSTFPLRGYDAYKLPVEIDILEHQEADLSRGGIIPLVYRRNSMDAAFFSAQSIMAVQSQSTAQDTEDVMLVSSLAYTLSICRIAHYIRCIMRDNVGGAESASYVENVLRNWLNGYVSSKSDPDELTLRHFPFKAAAVKVVPRPAEIGWFDCTVSVLPHFQFEGMEVELTLTGRIG